MSPLPDLPLQRAPDPVLSLLVVSQRSEEDRSSSDTLGRTLDLAGVAADEGLHACYFPERHARDDDYLSSPLTLAAVAAGRHPGLRVATGVALLPLHNPVTFAEQASVLDAATGGGLHRLGVGLGNIESEFQALGIPLDRMLDRFTAGLDIVARLWRGERVTARVDRDTSVTGASLTPRPTSPHAPLAIGAMSEAGVRRAGRLGLPWIADPVNSMEVLEDLAGHYWAEAGAGGSIALMRQAWASGPAADPERDWWPHVRDSIWRVTMASGRLADASAGAVRCAEDLRYDAFEERFATGTAAEVVRRARDAAARIGAEEIILRFGFATGPAHEHVRRSVRDVATAFSTTTTPLGGGR